MTSANSGESAGGGPPVKVSIAVPSLDYGRFLGRCLDSIAAQSHEALEVLVADGGSTDDSLAIIERRVRADARFRLVSREDRGQADAVNRALAHATGAIACYLNADDEYLDARLLARVVAAFARNPEVDVVTVGGFYTDAESRRLRPVRMMRHPLGGSDRTRWRNAVLQPGTFWRSGLSARIPFRSDMHYAFDAFFFYQLARECRWLELPDLAVGYRLHGANKSLDISAARVGELAELEAFKFGTGTFRPAYLRAVSRILYTADRLPPALTRAVKRGVYLVANSIAYATVHRVPGI